MQKYQSIISGTNGSVIRNVPVTVLKEDGSLAEIFLDREGQVPASNPLATDSRGVFYFYAVNGRYSLRTSVDGITITDADAVLLNDPEEISTAGPIADAVRRAEAAAQRAEFAVEASGIPDLVEAAQNAVEDAQQAVTQAGVLTEHVSQALIDAQQAKVDAENAAQTAASAATAAAQAVVDDAVDAAQAAAGAAAGSAQSASSAAADAANAAATAAEGVISGAVSSAASAKQAAEQAAARAETAAESAENAAASAENRVPMTGPAGAAILPEGTDAERPAPGATGLYVRLSKTSGKPEWYNRAKSKWQPFGDAGGELFDYAWHNGPRSSIDAGRVPTDGQQLLLLTHPDVCQAIWAGKQHSVTEAEWQTDPTKRNCWSRGDGSSWVRVPDLNAAVAGKPFYLRGGSDALNGTSVGDAIRNITGSFETGSNYRQSIVAPTGAFKSSKPGPVANNTGTATSVDTLAQFDASLVVPTADENRVKTAYGVMTVRVFTEVSNVGALDAGQLATQLGVVDAKVQALDANTGFTIIYPNGGTQASPATIALNSRYVESNPFPGYPVLCVIEVFYGGEWASIGLGATSASTTHGAAVGQHGSGSLVIITGVTSLITTGPQHYFSGARPTSAVTTPLPCRIKVWKLKGGA